MSWYGAHIAYKEEEAGLSGVVNRRIYSGWGHFGFHWITPFHNIAGMLTESASARLATPLYIHPDQLRGRHARPAGVRGADHVPQPLARRLVAAARHRRAAEGLGVGDARPGRAEPGDGAVERLPQGEAADRARRGRARRRPTSFPRAQHDPLTATKMVNKLLVQGIEIRTGADRPFVASTGWPTAPARSSCRWRSPRWG